MSTAAVFAGQGAQFVGMGKDLAEAFPAVKALYERANGVLGYDIAGLCFDGPAEELTKSNNCQPAIFVTSVACCTALHERLGDALSFDAVAGLSLGEWTALFAAGVVDFETTLKILEARGRFMQEACEETAGGMVSVMGLKPEQLQEVCTRTGVTIANLNSSKQTVLSGTKDGIAAAETVANELGAMRTVVLNVAGAFHSPLMRSAREKLAGVLADVTFSTPNRTVLSNFTGQPHTEPDAIREAMLGQVTDSVRWCDCIEWCGANRISAYVELGPGKVLSGLIKRIDRKAGLCNVQDAETLDRTVGVLQG